MLNRIKSSVQQRWSWLLLVCLIAAAPCARSDVLYAPLYRMPFDPAAPPQDLDGVRFEALVALDVPSLQELARWTHVPPVEHVLVSSDGRTLLMWSDRGPEASPMTLYVFDRHTMTLLRQWQDFTAPVTESLGLSYTGDRAVAHPTRPDVIVFGGVFWFDTRIGQWIETPQTIPLPAGWNSQELIFPRLSDDRRYLTLFRYGAIVNQLAVLVIDLASPQLQQVISGGIPGGVVAFGGAYVVHRIGQTGPYGVFERASGVERNRFVPPGAMVDMRVVPGEGVDFVLITSTPPHRMVIYHLHDATGTLQLLSNGVPYASESSWTRTLGDRDASVLTRSERHSCFPTVACGPGSSLLYGMDAAGNIVAERRSDLVAGVARWFLLSGNGAAQGGLPAPQPVPATGPPAWGVIVLGAIVAGALALRRRSRWREAPRSDQPRIECGDDATIEPHEGYEHD